MMVATDVQLVEAAPIASNTSKYSTYIHAQNTDLEEFERTADEIGEHPGRRAEEAAERAAGAAAAPPDNAATRTVLPRGQLSNGG